MISAFLVSFKMQFNQHNLVVETTLDFSFRAYHIVVMREFNHAIILHATQQCIMSNANIFVHA
jgi:hypothetical protein